MKNQHNSYLWEEEAHLSDPTPWICVKPPTPQDPFWTTFVQRIPIKQRRYVPGGLYWMFDLSLRGVIVQRMVAAGWKVNAEKPPELRGRRVKGIPSDNASSGSDVFFESLGGPVGSDPDFDLFYLQSKAPKEVVKAVYKALVMEFHPDIPANEGGDPERFRFLTEAKERIWNKRGWTG